MPTLTESSISQGEIVENDSITNSDRQTIIFNVTPCDGARCNVIIESNSNTLPFGLPIGKAFELIIGEAQTDVEEKLENLLDGLHKGHSKEININLTIKTSKEFQQSNIVGSKLSEKEPSSDSTESAQDKQGETCRGQGTITDSEENDFDKIKVTLIDFQNPPNYCDYTQQQKLEIAKYNKSKGIDMFKQGQRKFACRYFSKALKFLLLMLPRKDIPSEWHEEFDLLRLQCYSNMAACLLKENQYESVIWNCSKSLEIDKSYIKSIYRRAEAYFHLNKYDDCRKDVKTGLSLEPKSKVFHQLSQKLK